MKWPTLQSWKCLIIALCLCLPTVWAKNAGRLTLREVDRPLVMPKGIWQEGLLLSTHQQLYEGSTDTANSEVAGFLPSLPSWSITDRLTWISMPAPYFEYLLIGQTTLSDTGHAVPGFNLSLRGGITTVGYSSRDGFVVAGGAQLRSKQPFLERLWLANALGFTWDSQDHNTVLGRVDLGWQCSARTYLATRYAATYLLKSEESLHLLAVEMGVHFTPNISLLMQPGALIDHREPYAIFQSAINFQW